MSQHCRRTGHCCPQPDQKWPGAGDGRLVAAVVFNTPGAASSLALEAEAGHPSFSLSARQQEEEGFPPAKQLQHSVTVDDSYVRFQPSLATTRHIGGVGTRNLLF